MTAVIGKNGVGKSALFDAFGFMSDALKLGVEEACDARERGGFERIISQAATGQIEFEIYYREHGNARPITYEVAIDRDESGRPYVRKERLRQRRSGQKRGWPFSFLMIDEGRGAVWIGDKAVSQISEAGEQLDIDGLLKLIKSEESGETEFIWKHWPVNFVNMPVELKAVRKCLSRHISRT